MIDIKSVATEKMIYVNDREIPIIEDSLTAAEMLEKAGFSPTEYVLYTVSDGNGRNIERKRKPLKDSQRVKIENGARLFAALEPH
jgi:sulfur carrier protein ThiS